MQRLHAADLEAKETQLRVKDEEMKQRDAEISRLVEELRRCRELLRQYYGYEQSKGQEIKQVCTILLN